MKPFLVIPSHHSGPIRRIGRWGAVCAVFGIAHVGTPPGSFAHGRFPVGVGTDSTPLSTITTDTGAFAPGFTDFSRFTKPEECIMAAALARNELRHSLRTQIAHVFNDTAMTGDSMPAGAQGAARRCATRFTVAGTPASDLPDLFTLALMGGEDSLARAVTARRVALADSVAGKTAVLLEAVAGYLRAEPTRLAAAETTVTQIARFGPAAQAARLDGHGALLTYAMSRFDEPAMRREAERILALSREVPVARIRVAKEAVFDAYQALAQIAFVQHPDSVLPIVTAAKQQLGPFGKLPPGISTGKLAVLADVSTVSVSQLRNDMIPFTPEQYAGNPVPPVTASYWRPHAPASWPPGNGRVSLVIYGGSVANACARTTSGIINVNIENMNGCGPLYTYLPKWVRQYGAQLAITIVSQSRRHAARSLVLPPAAEADSLAWFFRDHLQLPVTVGLVEDSVWQLPPSDGREFPVDTSRFRRSVAGPGTWTSTTGGGGPLVVLLYGPHGVLRYVGKSTFDFSLLDKLLARLAVSGAMAQH